MEHKPSYEELLRKLAELEEFFRALRNQEVDAVVGTKNVFMLRLKETEDELKRQRNYLEELLTERTKLLEDSKVRQLELETTRISEDDAREYAESIINTVREPLIALDQDLRVVTASRSFYDVFKVNPKDTLGQLIYDLGNKQWNIPKLRELLETILPKKTTFDDYEVEQDFATIGKRTMLLNARQIKRVWGKERVILLAIEDITERREIENGLEKARKELETTKISEDAAREYAESIINTVREPLIVLDQNLRVVTASRSFYEFFKVNPKETVGQLIYDLGNKQWDIPKLRELLETILPKKTTFDDYEVEHDFATIGRRTMLLNARQIQRVWGKERIILLAIEDITERKQAEEALQIKTEDLEEANNELQQFAYVTSHDLREPLRMITGFTQSLEKRYKDKLDKAANEYIDFIVDGATRMQSLIDDILAYSRVGTRGIPFEQVNMEKALKDVLTNLKMAIEETDARITHDPMPMIQGDPVQMMQVLQNLISNAIKFHQEGEAPVIHVSARQEGHEYVFSVKDNGIGIDPELFGRLFILFQRLHTRDKYPGSGVGLAITKKIVGRHGGRTKVESQPGEGSTFYFSIPAKMKSDERGR